jgi:hypothetical protein
MAAELWPDEVRVPPTVGAVPDTERRCFDHSIFGWAVMGGSSTSSSRLVDDALPPPNVAMLRNALRNQMKRRGAREGERLHPQECFCRMSLLRDLQVGWREYKALWNSARHFCLCHGGPDGWRAKAGEL